MNILRRPVYVCISLYSLPFTGFESLPESVQTNLSKSPRNPPSNLPRDMEPSSLEVTDLFMIGPTQFKVGSEPPEPRLKYLENFHWYRAQGSNLERLAWKSGVLPPKPPVLCEDQ